MSAVVAFGELLLRLKAPGYERLLQSPTLEATFGGAEANVVMALAGWGVPTAFVTALPANAVAEAALAELRRHRVDVRHVVRTGHRVGTYYLEAGADHRPSQVVYDRAGSSLVEAAPDAFDWDAALEGRSWLHVSGITPALSARAAAHTLGAVRAARARGVTVSCDYNFRGSLWQWTQGPPAVMREIVGYVDVGIAGREDCQRVLGVTAPEVEAEPPDAEPDVAAYRALCERMLAEFPNLSHQAITLRGGTLASRYTWSACLHTRRTFAVSRRYDIHHVVDRVGVGDAFSAGLVYALLHGEPPAAAVELGAAAGCLKHTVPGDVARLTLAEVRAVADGAGGGRMRR